MDSFAPLHIRAPLISIPMKFLSGNSFPKPELLIKIANALDIDVRELFYPTKETETETIFIARDGNYLPIGTLKK